jgi:hypothetical protein
MVQPVIHPGIVQVGFEDISRTLERNKNFAETDGFPDLFNPDAIQYVLTQKLDTSVLDEDPAVVAKVLNSLGLLSAKNQLGEDYCHPVSPSDVAQDSQWMGRPLYWGIETVRASRRSDGTPPAQGRLQIFDALSGSDGRVLGMKTLNTELQVHSHAGVRTISSSCSSEHWADMHVFRVGTVVSLANFQNIPRG